MGRGHAPCSTQRAAAYNKLDYGSRRHRARRLRELETSDSTLIPHHIALQLHATPTADCHRLIRAECSGLSVVLCVGVPLFPCVPWCRRFPPGDATRSASGFGGSVVLNPRTETMNK